MKTNFDKTQYMWIEERRNDICVEDEKNIKKHLNT